MDGNPIEDIFATHGPMFVMSDGRIACRLTVDPDHRFPRRIGVSRFVAGGPRPGERGPPRTGRGADRRSAGW